MIQWQRKFFFRRKLEHLVEIRVSSTRGCQNDNFGKFWMLRKLLSSWCNSIEAICSLTPSLSLSLLSHSLSRSLAGVTCRFRDRSGFQLPFGRFHRNSDEHGHRDGGEIVSRCFSILKFFFSLLCGQGGTFSSHDYFELLKSKYSLD